MGASAEIQGRSFVVTTGAEGGLFKYGGAHGVHVLFIQDGRLHYNHNFLGEEEQVLASPAPVPLGPHTFGVASRGPERRRAASCCLSSGR